MLSVHGIKSYNDSLYILAKVGNKSEWPIAFFHIRYISGVTTE